MAAQAGISRFREAATQIVRVDGVDIVYRALGPSTGVPLLALNHLGANLDNWDPRMVDALAADRRVILLGYRGVGRSGGRVRSSIEAMAADAVAAADALGLQRFDLLGLSMGGLVAQEIVAREAVAGEGGRIDRLILSSAAPAGGPGVTDMTRTMVLGTMRASLALTDPKTRLFFTRTAAGTTAAREYLGRLRERDTDRDGAVSLSVIRAQLAAVHAWGLASAAGRSPFDGPVLILHGDSDRMIPVANVEALAQVFPSASVTVFPDAGHGVVFQYHQDVAVAMRAFLRR